MLVNLCIINSNNIILQIWRYQNVKWDPNMNLRILNIIKVWFCCCYSPTIPLSKKHRENSISVIQNFMKFYANIYPVTIFYRNLRKFMLNLKFYASFYFVSSGRLEYLTFLWSVQVTMQHDVTHTEVLMQWFSTFLLEQSPKETFQRLEELLFTDLYKRIKNYSRVFA